MGRARPARCDQHWGEQLWQGVELGVLNRVVLAVMAPQAPLPEAADEGYGLLQHGAPCRPWRPVVAEDVFVEVLSRPHAKHKAPW